MSNKSERNSAFNTAASTKVHHARLSDISQYTSEKLGHLRRGGIRRVGNELRLRLSRYLIRYRRLNEQVLMVTLLLPRLRTIW